MIGKIFLFIALVFFLLVLGGLFVVRGIVVEMQNQGVPVDELSQLLQSPESFQENLEGQPDYSDLTQNPLDIVDSGKITSKEATEAYQDYIDAYNKLTDLMSQGKGDTPEAQQAYAEYKEAKEKYEQIAKALK